MHVRDASGQGDNNGTAADAVFLTIALFNLKPSSSNNGRCWCGVLLVCCWCVAIGALLLRYWHVASALLVCYLRAVVDVLPAHFWSGAGAWALLVRCWCAACALLVRCWCAAVAVLVRCWCAASALLARCWCAAGALLVRCW